MIFLYLQDVLEERFRTEYLIAIVVAVGLLLIISLVVTTLLALRCQRSLCHEKYMHIYFEKHCTRHFFDRNDLFVFSGCVRGAVPH